MAGRTNRNLCRAKVARNDEFYTMMDDIEEEIGLHGDYARLLRGRRVMCCCDDPDWSNFMRFFVRHFDEYGLAGLVCTHYDPEGRATFAEWDGARGDDGEPLMRRGRLEGDGDFRSDEVREIMAGCDVVVTNPPFSLFRDFIDVVDGLGKDHIVIGSVNAITYRNVVPTLMAGRFRAGYTARRTSMRFLKAGDDGLMHVTAVPAMWFTSLPIDEPHMPIMTGKAYEGHEEDYPRFDDGTAIDVSRSMDVPDDYMGVMGVPVTFLGRMNERQFEVVTHCQSPMVGGRHRFKRLIIRRRPDFDPGDRDWLAEWPLGLARERELRRRAEEIAATYDGILREGSPAVGHSAPVTPPASNAAAGRTEAAADGGGVAEVGGEVMADMAVEAPSVAVREGAVEEPAPAAEPAVTAIVADSEPSEAASEPRRPEPANANLQRAKVARNDEFYTMPADVEAEVMLYREALRGRRVLCNCDDPLSSAFVSVLARRFGELGLSGLEATCYGGEGCPGDGAMHAVIETVDGWDGVSVAELLAMPGNSLGRLEGDGDFRGDECLGILDGCDVVVTNPPFSLFRDFMSCVMGHGKDVLAIGSINAVTYRCINPLIAEGRLWTGVNRPKEFATTSAGVGRGNVTSGEGGLGVARFGNIRWLTSLTPDAGRPEPVPLEATYAGHEAAYPRYDPPLDGIIEVSRVADIPGDYMGEMGVPITFVDRWSPGQFEVTGMLPAPVMGGRRLFKRLVIRRVDS